MRWTPEWTRRQVNISRMLVVRLPEILLRLECGDISGYGAAVIAEGGQDLLEKSHIPTYDYSLGQEISRDYVAMVNRDLADKSITEIRRFVRQAVATLAPLPADELFELACQKRRVELVVANDGMSWINAYLPSVEAQRVHQSVCETADRWTALQGSTSQNRADAFVALVCRTSTSDEVPSTVTEVQVTVPIETLLGLADIPGTINGSGDIVTANAVRALAEESNLRRLIVDPVSRQVTDFGRDVYRPPTGLRNSVVARDVVCRYPGCSRLAEKTDLDHVQAWEDGGTTKSANLVALCRRHHNLKTHGGWTYSLNDDGTTTWISPSGVKLTDPPHPLTPPPTAG